MRKTKLCWGVFIQFSFTHFWLITINKTFERVHTTHILSTSYLKQCSGAHYAENYQCFKIGIGPAKKNPEHIYEFYNCPSTNLSLSKVAAYPGTGFYQSLWK